MLFKMCCFYCLQLNAPWMDTTHDTADDIWNTMVSRHAVEDLTISVQAEINHIIWQLTVAFSACVCHCVSSALAYTPDPQSVNTGSSNAFHYFASSCGARSNKAMQSVLSFFIALFWFFSPSILLYIFSLQAMCAFSSMCKHISFSIGPSASQWKDTQTENSWFC